jgi:hypothetical protein
VIISPSRCSSVIPNHLNSDSYDQSTLGLYLISTGLRLADGGKPVPDWRAPVGCRRSRRPRLDAGESPGRQFRAKPNHPRRHLR